MSLYSVSLCVVIIACSFIIHYVKNSSREEKGRDMARDFQILDLKKILLIKFNNKGVAVKHH